MYVIELGMETDVREVHPWNVCPLISVTQFGMVMLHKEEQLRKAQFPILVTLLGRLIDSKDEH